MQSYGLVSIGSHSGIWLQEELNKHNSKKNILVEPVPYNIDQLEKNTKDFKDVIIERSAISDKNEIVSFFYLKKEIVDACKTIVTHEDAFIDLAFQMGPLNGLTADEIKQYIRFIGNRRLEQLGLDPIYDVKKNPLTWLDNMLNGVEHMNFFEGRATEYSKASTKGSWGEVFA